MELFSILTSLILGTPMRLSYHLQQAQGSVCVCECVCVCVCVSWGGGDGLVPAATPAAWNGPPGLTGS
jgi:streptolysin S family bacteriocin protoxin